jgi:hypothetical protein
MKIWAATRDENKILTETVMEFPNAHPRAIEEWSALIGELCGALDLARPVLLNKHRNDLNSFRRTSFSQEDFMEPVSFHKFTIELFPEKKK